MKTMSQSRTVLALALPVAGIAAAACSDATDRTVAPIEPAASSIHSEAPPAELADAVKQAFFGPASLELWPFTGKDLSGEPSDPMHLLFVGQSDPTSIRAALLALDADRSSLGLPPVPPFDCTWTDAAGGIQATWAGGGWSGSVIQLECGTYQGMRVHLRLFPAGDWTAGAAHFEVLIPGTTDHQVLSWDLAKQFVLGDLRRTGLLHPDFPFDVALGLTPSPTFRTIPHQIYNGLPPALRGLIEGPIEDVSAPVGIPNDGNTVIVNLAGDATPVRGTVRNEFVVEFNQTVPKPMCARSPTDWIHATGPVRFTHEVVTNAMGHVNAQIQIVGSLEVTPIDISTGTPTGETRRAQVTDHYSASTLGPGGRVSLNQLRLVTASGGDPAESERVRFQVGPHGMADYSKNANCMDG